MQRQSFPRGVAQKYQCGDLESNHPDNACKIRGVQSSARGQVVGAEREHQEIAPQIELTPVTEGKGSGYRAVQKPRETGVADINEAQQHETLMRRWTRAQQQSCRRKTSESYNVGELDG